MFKKDPQRRSTSFFMSGRTLISFENWRVEMKRKIIALLLIAIMALTVFSAVAVTTTQKVEAKSTSPTSVVVPYYKSGTKYIYKPSEFNKYDYATYRIIEGSKPFIFQYAVWGNAFSSMRVSSEQQFNSYAYVGIVAQLDHMNQT